MKEGGCGVNNRIRIIHSKLTDTIYAGKLKIDNTGFVANKKQDVTSDFLGAIISMYGNTESIIQEGETLYKIRVEKIGVKREM